MSSNSVGRSLLIGIGLFLGLVGCDSGGGPTGPEMKEGKIAINSVRDLRKIGTDESFPLDANYLLVEDVDASGTATLNGGNGFRPIATSGDAFRGIFDGNGFTISGLTVNRPDADSVGLFAATRGARIKNVTLAEIDVKGRRKVGGLAGTGTVTDLSEVTVRGSVRAIGPETGGMVGDWSGGVIANSSADVSVEAEYAYTGGLVGENENGEIRTSTASGTVRGSNYVGGLTGSSKGRSASRAQIVQCLARGDVSGTNSVGGLVGSSRDASIRRSHASGDVKGSDRNIGGLLGVGDPNLVVAEASAEGDVSGSVNVGGLVGRLTNVSDLDNGPRVRESAAEGVVTGKSKVGGLVGLVERSRITGSFAADSISGETVVGGLVGLLDETSIRRSFALGVVEGTEEVGGLIGQISFPERLREIYAAGRVSGSSAVGGLVGRRRTSEGSIEATYWDTRATRQDDPIGTGTTKNVEATGLTTGQMQGGFAKENMDEFDFEDTWQTVGNDYPALWWRVY